MTIDQLIDILKVSLPEGLTSLQEMVLRSSWDGKTYALMASETNYVKEYLSRAASELWSSLSDFWEEPIGKNNLRRMFESRPLTKAQRQLLEQFQSQSLIPVLEFPGAPVGLDSKLYIERPPIETLAYEEITKPGSIIRIKAPWKMGKTSLLLRIINQAESYQYSAVNIDFQQAEKTTFSSVDKFFRWFSRNISWKLKISPNLDDYWDEDMGNKVSCTIYFEAYLLQQIETNLVLGLNEVNRLFEYPDIAEEFFSLLRSWYEQAKSNPIWKKLRLVLTYSTEIYIPLNINQSPFNVGLPLKLPAFDPEQVLSLALRHGLDWTSTQTKQLMAMVGGHPFLVRLGLYYLCRGELTLKQLLQEAVTETGIYSSHLRQILAVLQADPQLEKAFKQVIYADQPIKLASVVTYKLDSMGIVTLKGDSVIYSCELYRVYFKNQLLE